MRGGPSTVLGNRHVKRGERKTVYEHMSNLYGWSMPYYLPTGDFHEIEFRKKDKKDFLKLFLRNSDNNKCGYLLKCDLEYSSKRLKEEDFSHFFQIKKELK